MAHRFGSSFKIGNIIDYLVYGATKSLRGYEIDCVTRLLDALPDPVAAIVRLQIEGYTGVQRRIGRVLHFGYRRNESVPRVKNREEVNAARIDMLTASGEKLSCRIQFADGRLNTLTFSKPVKVLGKAGYRIAGTKILNDLTTTESHEPAQRFGPLLDELSKTMDVTDVLAAASARQIEDHVSALATTMPEDLQRLLRETNGFRFGAYVFQGTNARDLPIPGGLLHIYLGNDHSFDGLCLREGGAEPRVWRYDQIDEKLEYYGPTFIPAIKRLVATPYHRP